MRSFRPAPLGVIRPCERTGVHREDQYGAPGISAGPAIRTSGRHHVRIIASSVRKGNVLDIEGRLYVVLNAESFFPGKGTPTTQIDMRRISDGVKTQQRYKTTEHVERALVEEREYQFLYHDGDGYHFMNTENYDQVALQEEDVGDQGAYLQPEMKVKLSVHEGKPISLELPQKVTLEATETEPRS